MIPLSGSVGFALACGSTSADGGGGLATPLALTGRGLLGGAGLDLRLLGCGPLGGFAGQPLLGRQEARQPVLPTTQRRRQLVTPQLAVQGVLGDIGRLGFGQDGGDLLVDRLGRAVRRQRRIGRHLRAVQRDHAQARQTGRPTQPQHRDEHHLHPFGVPSAEARDHAVIRHVLADDHPEAHVPPAQALHLAAGAMAVGVGVDQHRQHHGRCEGRLPGTSRPVLGFETRQVHLLDRIEHQVDEVALGQPVQHVHRQQKALPAIRLAEEGRHGGPRVGCGITPQRITRSSHRQCYRGGRLCNRLRRGRIMSTITTVPKSDLICDLLSIIGEARKPRYPKWRFKGPIRAQTPAGVTSRPRLLPTGSI